MPEKCMHLRSMQVVPSQSTILVTGAGGFVGSHVVLELLSQDYNVIAVDNYTNCVKGVGYVSRQRETLSCSKEA
ncbi:hypothetical protein D918_09993 [Trichuris suis]|nr:hypothetical protein D918_09993 [Trichuris suis]